MLLAGILFTGGWIAFATITLLPIARNTDQARGLQWGKR